MTQILTGEVEAVGRNHTMALFGKGENRGAWEDFTQKVSVELFLLKGGMGVNRENGDRH